MQANHTTIVLNWHKWNHFFMKWVCCSDSEFLLWFLAENNNEILYDLELILYLCCIVYLLDYSWIA